MEDIQRKFRVNKVVTDYSGKDLEYLIHPIGRAHYESTADPNEGWEDTELSYSSDDDFAECITEIPKWKHELYDVSDEPSDYVSEELSEQPSDSESPIFTRKSDLIKLEPKDEHSLKTKLIEAELEKITNKHWSDRITCEICGKVYTRGNVTSHRGTQIHRVYEKANKRLLKLMRGK